MKRDMDIVRTILLKIEDSEESPLGWTNIEIPDQPPELVSYHVLLLTDAGLVESNNLSTRAGLDVRPKRLTWEGHEFLDAAKNDTIWNKAKDLVKEKGGSIPFEVLKGMLIKMTASLFGLG
jgi:hypothetical protein